MALTKDQRDGEMFRWLYKELNPWLTPFKIKEWDYKYKAKDPYMYRSWCTRIITNKSWH